MPLKTQYRLNRHRKFEKAGQKYVADLETHDVIEVNDVEWDILSRYATQTQHQIVETLKAEYKPAAVFEGLTRLEWLGKRGKLLSRTSASAGGAPMGGPRRLLVPLGFKKESGGLDYMTHLNRGQLLTALSEDAALETQHFSPVQMASRSRKPSEYFGKVRIRHVNIEDGETFMPAWYATAGYDGILLLSQFMTDDLLYYQVPDIPIVQCIENSQQLPHAILEACFARHAAQKANDRFVVKASWMQQWLCACGIPREQIHVIPDGIDVAKRIDKGLAKQQTAHIFDKPMFAQRPVVGLISGCEPHRGAEWIAAFAAANPHLAIFVYDFILAHHYKTPPDNVVIFRADDAEMSAILPLFLQALDLVCFPTLPGTPVSVVLEAMAYGTPCVAMTQDEMPPEVAGAGVSVPMEWDCFGDFQVSMDALSGAIHQGLEPSQSRAEHQRTTSGFSQRYTWQAAARKMLHLLEQNHPARMPPPEKRENLFRPIFCRRYHPQTHQTTSDAYRLGINRYEPLEKALAETLSEHHNPTEVASVFKHLKMEAAPARQPRRERVEGVTEIDPPAPEARRGEERIFADVPL